MCPSYSYFLLVLFFLHLLFLLFLSLLVHPLLLFPRNSMCFGFFCNPCISFIILTSMYHFIKRCSCCSCCSWCNWCSCSNSCCYYGSFCFYSAPVPVAPAVPAAVLVPVSRHVHAVPTGFLSRKYLKGKLGMPWEVS